MAILRHTQEIDRSVEDVFGTVIDGGRFATWNPTISASSQLTPHPIGEDTRFEWKLEMVPKWIFKVFSPLMARMGKKNLDATASALDEA